jgi:hypothetical protein
MVRWRIMHTEVSNKQWSGIRPIYVWDKKQYYIKQTTFGASRATFNPLYYYQEVPQREIDKNKLLKYNHK